MLPGRQVAVAVAGFGLLMQVTAGAQAESAVAPRIRADSEPVRQLIDELVERSETGRALVERLNASDVTVYVRCRDFGITGLRGRTGMVRSDRPTRFLIVEIEVLMPSVERLVYLAHELQHAAEIAYAPGVVDARTLAALYARIGERTQRGPESFETREAQDVADQVRRELTTVSANADDR